MNKNNNNNNNKKKIHFILPGGGAKGCFQGMFYEINFKNNEYVTILKEHL